MKRPSPLLVVDVGSASVGACIVEDSTGAPTISRVKRVELENASGRNTADLALLAKRALTECLGGLAAAPRPAAAHVVLAAPWYKATVSVISSVSERPVRIAEEAVERSLGDYRRQHRTEVLPGRATVEAAVTKVYVNGYPTALTEPLRGSALSLDYYESEADEAFLAALTEGVRRAFPGVAVSFHSFLFAAFAALRAVRDETSFVILDIGGEITDVALARRDGIAFVGSFPYGARSFLRAVALAGGSLADAASRATLYAAGELSEAESAAFTPRFAQAAADWNGAYQALLEHAALETPVPHTTFVITDTEPSAWFARAIAGADAPFPARPVIVSRDFFKNAVLLGEDASYDPFLSVAALYLLRIAR